MNDLGYSAYDLESRIAIAACAVGCLAGKLATKTSMGSGTFCEDKNLEIAVEQLNIIRTKFKVLALPAKSTMTVLGDGATGTDSTITVDGTTISLPFQYSGDNNATAEIIADAINNFTSTPDYKATVLNNAITITVQEDGAAINGLAVAIVGGDVNMAFQFMHSGQDGVQPEDNVITEQQLDDMFMNIAKITGASYGPLGYVYTT